MPVDELYERVKALALTQGRISVEVIQRKLGTGYARATQLIDLLEEKGVIESGHIDRTRKIILPEQNFDLP